MKTLAISIGDLNGVGIEIALKSHTEIKKLCNPIYCINKDLLSQAAKLLNISIPDDFVLEEVPGSFDIVPGLVNAKSGYYAYDSFMSAINLCETKKADGVVTMPIHKEAWMMAGLEYKGHTDLLRKHFNKDAIMMLGCEEMFVALYTEHMPLKDVPATIKKDKLVTFLLNLNHSISDEKVAVLGLNPHAGDNGVLGDEEREIELAIKEDKRTIDQLLGCIDWIYTSPTGGFWIPNILSARKLREKFDVMESQMINSPKNKSRINTALALAKGGYLNAR